MSSKTPWHIWVIGGVSLLWNAMGLMDFTMSNLRSDAYMAQMTEAQMAFFNGFPLWVTVFWAIAVIGAVLGSLLILLRKKLAVPVFLAAFIAMVITSIHNYLLSPVRITDIAGTGALIFSAIIFVVALLLLFYSKAQARAGHLR